MSILFIVFLVTASVIASGALASPKFRQEILNYRDSALFYVQDSFPDVEYVREAANNYSQRTQEKSVD